LVAHAGQVVSKGRLFEAVWPKTVVSEGMLKDYIKQIRQALATRHAYHLWSWHVRGNWRSFSSGGLWPNRDATSSY
jgi:DNA-binding response OmpR family regulator